MLQPKSSNLPETQKNPAEAIVSALIPGSENVKSAEEKKKAMDAAQVTPRQEGRTPIKEEKPVLG